MHIRRYVRPVSLAVALAFLAGAVSGQDTKPQPPATGRPPAAPPVSPFGDPNKKPEPPKLPGTGAPAGTKPAVPGTGPGGLGAPPAFSGQMATINVQCLPHATIWIEGQKMTTAGAVRSFQSPPLEAGKVFYYTFKVSWPTAPGQQDSVMEQEVTVRAGQTTVLDFRPQAAPPPLSQPYYPPGPGRRPVFGRPEGSGIR